MINYGPLIFYVILFLEYKLMMMCWKYDLHRFQPHILIDASKINMTTIVLGFKISMSIMIPLTSMQKMAYPEGKNSCNLSSMWIKFTRFNCLGFDLN